MEARKLAVRAGRVEAIQRGRPININFPLVVWLPLTGSREHIGVTQCFGARGWSTQQAMAESPETQTKLLADATISRQTISTIRNSTPQHQGLQHEKRCTHSNSQKKNPIGITCGTSPTQATLKANRGPGMRTEESFATVSSQSQATIDVVTLSWRRIYRADRPH